MNYLVDVLLWAPLVLGAFGASYFRLRKRLPYFWGFVGLGLIYCLVVSAMRGRSAVGFVADLLGFALIYFVVDVFMDLRRKRSR